MTTKTLDLDPDLGALFDLDVQVEFDSTTVTDILSSIWCGWSECGTGDTCSTCNCTVIATGCC